MKYEIKIPDINCNHCIKRISDILREYNVAILDYSLEKKVIIIDRDVQEYKDKIANQLSELGYEIEYLKKVD